MGKTKCLSKRSKAGLSSGANQQSPTAASDEVTKRKHQKCAPGRPWVPLEGAAIIWGDWRGMLRCLAGGSHPAGHAGVKLADVRRKAHARASAGLLLRWIGATALGCLALGLLAPSSSLAATTYYSSPSGSGTTCTQAEACAVSEALGMAASGDTVVMAGDDGTYQSPGMPALAELRVPNGVTLTGAPGQPRPIWYSASSEQAVTLEGFGEATLSDVDIEYSGTGRYAAVFGAGTINRVIAHATAGGLGCQAGGSLTITDSICAGFWGLDVNFGGGGVVTVTLRNSTVYGSQYGLELVANGTIDLELGATNTIARGGTADIHANAIASTAAVHAQLEYSNYSNVVEEGSGHATVTGAGTNLNQTASPLFVNLGAGDFHEAAGSPTINAGTDSPLNGPFDLEGNPRDIGSHTDIGAYEFLIPPSTVTSPATSVGPTTATLNGTVDPNGVATTLRFVYGTSTAYGSTSAAASAGSGTSGSGASATLTELAPNTTYHYQLLASNSIGESGGGDRTFTTPPTTATVSTQPTAMLATLTGLSETNKTFAPGSASTPLTGLTAKAHKRGTTFAFTLDQAATVTVEIERKGSGRRVRSTCKPNSKRLHHKPKCTLYTTVATLTRSGHAGLNKLAFSGRIRGKALKPGHYRAVFATTDSAGN